MTVPEPLGPDVRPGHSPEGALATDEGLALPRLEADAGFEALRRPDEQLHAIYRGAMLEVTPADGTTPLLLLGDLYLTSVRLLHADGQLFELLLAAIDIRAVALERLVVIRLLDGSQVAMKVDDPRLLHGQIAAAQAAAEVSP